MKRASYCERDFAFGQMMLTLRTAIGLTQVRLADFLGVSRRAVSDWEAGSSYPKVDHFKAFIAMAVERRAFPAGHEAAVIHAIWKAAHQKVLLDEYWLADLLRSKASPATETNGLTPESLRPADEWPQKVSQQAAFNNLPFQPTLFVGRGTELNEIVRILNDPACRLLTLIGPGGIGKTHLALKVAARQRAMFPDGVVFVALGSFNTPNQIVSAVGDALNLTFDAHTDPALQLLEFLRERHMLLVLDDFGHLIESADLVHYVLENAPHITIPVTSRARLYLQAEWLFDVEGLLYPSGELLSPAELTNYSAVQQPLAASALGETMGVPAWKSLPSWFLVATNDEVIPPDAERMFAQRMGATVVEVASSHVVMVSHPADVVNLIKTATETVSTGG